MRKLKSSELDLVSGGYSIWGSLAEGIGVIWGALNGDAPGPSSLTGTASGPTPGGRGGRYPETDRYKPVSINNMPGGQIGRAIGGGSGSPIEPIEQELEM